MLIDLGADATEIATGLELARQWAVEDRDARIRAAMQFISFGATVH